MSFMKLRTWLSSLLVLALVACGGGGSGGSSLFNDPKSASDVQIKFSASSVDNSGTQNVTATITAINANGQGVAGVPLTIKVDNNATFSTTGTTGTTTGSDGTVSATVTIGNDYTLRTITMTVGGGSLPTRTNSFQVVGSTKVASDLTLSVAPSITNSISNSATVTVTAVDSNRNALPNIPVAVAVDAGATFVPSGTVTGSTGTITGVLRIGQDQTNRTITVTATSGTVVRTASVLVTGAKLTSSGLASSVAVGSTGNKVTYLLVDNTGAKMVGYPITVTSTGSGVNAVNGTTNADGEYVYTYTAPATAQSMNIQASAGGALTLDTVVVTSTVLIPPASVTVTSASVSASPNVVAVNPLGAAVTNKVEVRALFLGANNAPVKNVRAWFDLNGDKQSIGGTLASTAAGQQLYSDPNGVARTTYAPGPRFSPKDGVTIRVCWSASDMAIPAEGGACTNSALTTLTVISESLSVSIGTNGSIGVGASGVTYTQRFAVQVVDSAGQAKAGVQIAPSIDLLSYYKGQWIVSGPKWVISGFPNTYPSVYPNGVAVPYPTNSRPLDKFQGGIASCDNEDLNRNGVSETFFDTYQQVNLPEDQNGSASLTPQRPALDPRKADVTISFDGPVTTDSNGIVVLKIEYPQNLGSWIRYNILVSASGVAGTEGRANYENVLAVLASAVTNITTSPPFQFSPYGTQGSPTYLRQNAEGQSGWLCTDPN